MWIQRQFAESLSAVYAHPIILASSSPRRSELLHSTGVTFDVFPSRLKEPQQPSAAVSPRGWAEALSYYKARSVADEHLGEWIVGADTIVVCGGEILGKPRDAADAARMLELQAGTESAVITGVSLVRSTHRLSRLIASALTRVWMRDSAALRGEYLESGDWSGKAGAYGIQDVGDRLVERIDGDFDNVVGLPCRLVRKMLALIGNGGLRAAEASH